MSRPICRHCGLPEEEHCKFEPVDAPIGCVCDPGTWGDNITKVCSAYVGDGNTYCATCEHDKACHKEVQP